MSVKRISFAMVMASSLLLTVGCSSGVQKAASSSGNQTGAAKDGGTLTISLDADPPKLDPSLSSSFVEAFVFQSIFDKLVDLNDQGKIVPMLAEKWDVSGDSKTYTFHLRQGVKFHDGTDFNADAVKFNFERNMQKISVRKNELGAVDKVSVVDPYTVKVDLKQPYAPFLSVLSDRAGLMVSPAAVKKYGDDFMNHPVGTGPFVFKDHLKGTSVTLEKNPNYWQKGLPHLDKVVYKVIPDANVALMNLKSGQIDMSNKFPYNELAGIKSDPKVGAVSEPGLGFQGFFLNTSKPPFDKPEVRQAVDMLIDRNALVNVLLKGAGSAAHSPFAPNTLAYGDSDKADAPNLAKAKELLQKAGMANGFSFSFKTGTSAASLQSAEMIQNMLKPAGIDVKLEKLEFGTLLEQTKSGNFEASALSWSGFQDPDQNIYDFYTSKGNLDFAKYNNPKVDTLLNDGRKTVDASQRKDMYNKVMDILHNDVPYVYLYHNYNVFGVSKAVHGFTYVQDGLIRTANLSKQ
jgi:peptide/nickel transport system substrate-binding protein